MLLQHATTTPFSLCLSAFLTFYSLRHSWLSGRFEHQRPGVRIPSCIRFISNMFSYINLEKDSPDLVSFILVFSVYSFA